MNHLAIAPEVPFHLYNAVSITRPAYDFDAFKNREETLREVRLRVADAQSGREIRQSVLLAWGIHGVGKSWFLRHVEHEFEFQACVGKKKGVFATLVDLASHEEMTTADLPILLEEMTNLIVDRVKLDRDHREKLEAFRQALNSEKTDEVRIASRFVALIDSLTSHFVPILLFDSLEKLESDNYDLFSWIEKHLFAPLVRWDKTLLVLASRRELRRFNQFEVRRRLKKLPLEAFPPAFTAKQVGSEQIGSLLYSITYGHPLATWFIQNELNRVRPKNSVFDDRFFEEKRTEVVDLLGMVEDWLLMDVSDARLRSRLTVAATLRYFHIRSLQVLLASVEENDSLLEENDTYFQHLIGGMVDSNLVRWSMEHHGYQVDTTVRHIMNRFLSLQSSQEFTRRHEEAFRLYDGWIKDTPWNSDRYIVEAAYHLGVIAEVRPRLRSEVEKRLAQLLDQVFDEKPRMYDLERADTILQNLRHDDELRGTAPFLYAIIEERLSSIRDKLEHNL